MRERERTKRISLVRFIAGAPNAEQMNMRWVTKRVYKSTNGREARNGRGEISREQRRRVSESNPPSFIHMHRGRAETGSIAGEFRWSGCNMRARERQVFTRPPALFLAASFDLRADARFADASRPMALRVQSAE